MGLAFLPTFTTEINPDLGKYTIPMDPMSKCVYTYICIQHVNCQKDVTGVFQKHPQCFFSTCGFGFGIITKINGVKPGSLNRWDR